MITDTCTRCGATAAFVAATAPMNVCPACRAAEREPQGEAVKLFEPAPTQLPGQLAL